jgi:selenide,water dikinase
MPVVDDPFDFGRIAATNALSDIYAMGARPLFALAIVGMPVSVLPVETIGAVLAGGAQVCAQAGIPVAGGHSIDSVEPIYGLVVVGLVRPDRVLTNRTGQAGDVLILSKALGVGVLSAAFKQERLSAEGYGELIASTTQLNAVGPELAAMEGVHAMTDVTGFGLLGHALEMARGAGLTAEIVADAPAVLAEVEELAIAGVRTGASSRNWASYGASVDGAAALPAWRRDLLCDPQTSGGLLVAVDPAQADAVLQRLGERGFGRAAVVGRLKAGPARIELVEAGAAARQ